MQLTGKIGVAARLPQIGWVLYGLSLALPAMRSIEPFHAPENIARVYGIVFLVLGWVAVAAPVPGVAWLANPLLLIAVVLRKKKPRIAFRVAFASMVMSWVSLWAFMVFDVGAVCWIASFPCITYGWWRALNTNQ